MNTIPDDLRAHLARRLERPPANERGIAKYARLGQALLEAIETGLCRPGEKLPTEAQLAAGTPFSLGTVQNAYRTLVERGVVVRIQGSGTFVAEARHRMDAPWHCRFLDDDGNVLPVYTKVLSRTLVRERGGWSDALAQAGENILRIDRRIGIDDEFAVFSRFFVDAHRFAGLLETPLRRLDGENFKLLLSRQYGTTVTRLSQTLSIGKASADVSDVLIVKRGATVTRIDVRASTSGGETVYFQELHLPPNGRRLRLDDGHRR